MAYPKIRIRICIQVYEFVIPAFCVITLEIITDWRYDLDSLCELGELNRPKGAIREGLMEATESSQLNGILRLTFVTTLTRLPFFLTSKRYRAYEQEERE